MVRKSVSVHQVKIRKSAISVTENVKTLTQKCARVITKRILTVPKFGPRRLGKCGPPPRRRAGAAPPTPGRMRPVVSLSRDS